MRFDPEAAARAKDVGEVLPRVAEHARTVHNVKFTPELAEKVNALIKDEARYKSILVSEG